MSLDVYLESDSLVPSDEGDQIFIREDGQTKKISREEWDRRFPDREPVTFTASPSHTLYTANITHNLNRMAQAAGIYKALWRPEEIGIAKAKQLVPLLERGLEAMRADPDRYRKYNPKNGWGDYRGLVGFVERYLEACREYPEATVKVWR